MADLENAIPIGDLGKTVEDEAIELSEPTAEATGGAASKIRTFGREDAQEHEWQRQTNADGTGAVRVRTFHASLNHDAMVHLDERINEWLDAHADLEVKFVTTTVGEMAVKTGKEIVLIMSVWV
ncbi:MAG: hypothetical protein CMJ49_07520 [Planctomycetaceae bacterium]|nr:hypothetical protein [Planctomycetaceae bacterium]